MSIPPSKNPSLPMGTASRPVTGTIDALSAVSDVRGSYKGSLNTSIIQSNITNVITGQPSHVQAQAQIVVPATPMVDTIVPGMTFNVPAGSASRQAYASANISFSSAHNNLFSLYLDGNKSYPSSAYATANGPTGSGHYSLSLALIPITIPGDGRSHQISLRYKGDLVFTATTLLDRSLTVSVVQ